MAVVLGAEEIIGDASPKLTERGIVEPEDFPLMPPARRRR
jgi:hypothetical protein